MITVNEAINIINASILNLPQVQIPLEKALGRILRQPIIADMDFPPFDRIMMDGIAIKYEDFAKGLRSFRIQGIQAAGSPQMALTEAGCCLEVMTGAVTPLGADVIVPYEEVKIDQENLQATIHITDLKKGKNIHVKGTDKKKGAVLITEGTLIGTPEIAVAASVGASKVWVTKNPTVAIISTGNELVEIQETPLPHQIRRSNVYAIAAEMRKFGIKADLYHFKDDKDDLITALEKVLKSHDIVILSGGVSMGKFDFIPETLIALGVEQRFHRIQQKPGKPFWFGVKDKEKVVFAFPGNPVSTFLCYHKYLVPWLRKSLGLHQTMDIKAILAEDVNIKTSLTYFLQVKTNIDYNGQLLAYPIIGKGSGDLANLLVSDAFLELPANGTIFKKGDRFKLIPFRSF